jgi:hypothetical protein
MLAQAILHEAGKRLAARRRLLPLHASAPDGSGASRKPPLETGQAVITSQPMLATC